MGDEEYNSLVQCEDLSDYVGRDSKVAYGKPGVLPFSVTRG